MYHKHVFENGITLIVDEMSHVRSVSIGIWVKVGTKHEDSSENGISHFIEHMMFKGTRSKSAQQIAETIDGVGGQLGAFTSREHTCYYAKVSNEHVTTAISLLSDIFLNSLFDSEEVEKEKRVVLEEIKMVEDDPQELIHDLFTQTIWGSSSLGQPILGKASVINSLDSDRLIDFWHTHYTPDRIVISVAGNVDYNLILKEIGSFFNSSNGTPWGQKMDLPEVKRNLSFKKRDLEQIHLCLGVPGLPYTDKDRYALLILNTILGGGMSSRLFQEIREKRGLAYAVYSYQASYKDAGLFVVYMGTSPKNLQESTDIIFSQFFDLKNNGITDVELGKAKEQLKGNLILHSEDTYDRMTRLARHELYFKRFFTLDETLHMIDEVNLSQVKEVARSLFQSEYLNLVLIGNVKEEDVKRVKLEC
ncbi:MAG: pitrilysin family protein [bacterium]|nr:pitrilysin family protein [bacterium]